MLHLSFFFSNFPLHLQLPFLYLLSSGMALAGAMYKIPPNLPSRTPVRKVLVRSGFNCLPLLFECGGQNSFFFFFFGSWGYGVKGKVYHYDEVWYAALWGKREYPWICFQEGSITYCMGVVGADYDMMTVCIHTMCNNYTEYIISTVDA
jgi:hypothetical protein